MVDIDIMCGALGDWCSPTGNLEKGSCGEGGVAAGDIESRLYEASDGQDLPDGSIMILDHLGATPGEWRGGAIYGPPKSRDERRGEVIFVATIERGKIGGVGSK